MCSNEEDRPREVEVLATDLSLHTDADMPAGAAERRPETDTLTVDEIIELLQMDTDSETPPDLDYDSETEDSWGAESLASDLSDNARCDTDFHSAHCSLDCELQDNFDVFSGTSEGVVPPEADVFFNAPPEPYGA